METFRPSHLHKSARCRGLLGVSKPPVWAWHIFPCAEPGEDSTNSTNPDGKCGEGRNSFVSHVWTATNLGTPGIIRKWFKIRFHQLMELMWLMCVRLIQHRKQGTSWSGWTCEIKSCPHGECVSMVHSMIFLSLLLLLDNKVLTTWSSVAMCKPDL